MARPDVRPHRTRHRDCRYSAPAWRHLSPCTCRSSRSGRAARDERDRGVPDRGARRPHGGLRRTAARHASPIILAATALSEVSGASRAAWLAAREADLLPVPYFHVVFTLPAPIAAIAFQNKASFMRSVQSRRRGDVDARRQSTPARCRDRRRRRPPHLGQALTHHPPSTASCRAAAPRPMARAGSPADQTSSWPSSRSPGCSDACSSNVWTAAFNAGTLHFFGDLAALAGPTLSRVASKPCDASTGLFTPSGPSADPPRSWPISAATPIALRSPTAGSSPSTTIMSLQLEGLSPNSATKIMSSSPASSFAASFFIRYRRFPPHPPLRLHGQPPSRCQARALPLPSRS